MGEKYKLVQEALRDCENAAIAIKESNFLQADILLQLARDQLIDAGVIPQ